MGMHWAGRWSAGRPDPPRHAACGPPVAAVVKGHPPVDAVELHQCLATTGDGFVAVDPDFRIIAWNAAATRLFGIAPEVALGRSCFDVMRWEDRFGNPVCFSGCAAMTLCSRGVPVRTFECTSAASDVARGSAPVSPWLSVSSVAVMDRDGQFVALVHLVRALTPAAAVAAAPSVSHPSPAMTRPEAPLHGRGAPARPPAPPIVLSRREGEVWALLSTGATPQEISSRLGIRKKTAANYVNRLLTKLGVHSRLQAVLMASQPRGTPPEGAHRLSRR